MIKRHGFYRRLQLEILLLSHDDQTLHHRFAKPLHTQNVVLHRQLAGLQPFQVGQFDHHAIEPARLFKYGLRRRFRLVCRAINDGLRIALNRCQRRLQIVRDITEEVALSGICR